MAEDHPRVCGNHGTAPRSESMSIGSPPRVREPPCHLALDVTLPGITPACAGTTRTETFTFIRHWDHPRVCGNHLFCLRRL